MKISITKTIILIICFLIAGYFVYNQPESKLHKKNISLNQVLSTIDDGWKIIGQNPLEQSIVDELKLDDYTYQSYLKKEKQVSLYIGYYFSGDKIGAAHDPLVCFPGQGWVVKEKSEGNFTLAHDSQTTITYSKMVVEKGQDRQLILYWFQSYDKTNPNTFYQKIDSLLAKIFQRGEDSAFVRISMPVGKESVAESKETITDFVDAFYPVFLKYICN
jgi:EpsI family protein